MVIQVVLNSQLTKKMEKLRAKLVYVLIVIENNFKKHHISALHLATPILF